MLKSFYRDEGPSEFEIHDENVASQQFVERLGIANVIKQWRTIVVVVVACVGVAFVYVLIAPRQYKATALVSIDSTGDSVMRTATAPPDFNVQSANVDGQVEVMRSEQLLRRVAAAVSKDGAVTKDSASAALLSLNTSSSWPFGALVPWPASTDDTASNADTVQELIKRTSAKRRGLTHIVELTAAMPDRESAAAVANAYAGAFIADQTRRREESARRTSQMLQARAVELEQKAQDAQRAVEQLKFTGSQQGENSATARVTLQTLESTAQTYRLLHDKFLERYAETWQQQFLSVPDAQIVSQAYPPTNKSAPRTLLILAAALLIGVSLGTIAVLLRERMPTRLSF